MYDVVVLVALLPVVSTTYTSTRRLGLCWGTAGVVSWSTFGVRAMDSMTFNDRVSLVYILLSTPQLENNVMIYELYVAHTVHITKCL
jgi:hypothetical protein